MFFVESMLPLCGLSHDVMVTCLLRETLATYIREMTAPAPQVLKKCSIKRQSENDILKKVQVLDAWCRNGVACGYDCKKSVFRKRVELHYTSAVPNSHKVHCS